MVKYISIPKKFENILRDNQGLEAIVKQTAADFSLILRENRLLFFDEYTDHGIEHIERVLLAAEEVINIDTLRTFTFAVHKSVSEQIQPGLDNPKFCGGVGLIGLRSKIRRWDGQC